MLKHKKTWLFVLLITMLATTMLITHNGITLTVQAANPNAPTNLRITDNFEQFGIDQPNPKLAWYVNDTDRAETQTGYRVIVASSQTNIDNNTGDLWDTGKVMSSNQYGVAYGGTALQSNKQYWWKVMTWDKDANQSAWSLKAAFVTGFMTPSDWTASWISSSSNSIGVPYLLRKQFSVSKTVSQAYAYICGVGQFELSLNGAKVGDHQLDPAWTEYKKTCQYVTFDVTSRILSGNNVIGVYLADGFMDLGNANSRYQYFAHSDGVKRMIMELNIQYTDGTSSKVVSDTSWKTATGPITWCNTFGGEDYDATKEKSGWDNVGYNDSSWASAVTTTSPGGTLKAQCAPPIKVIQTLNTVSMTEPVAGKVVCDLGMNFEGVFEVSVSGTAGQTISIYPGESLNGSNLVNASVSPAAYCKYTLKGSGTEVWRPKFWYWGFRYVEIDNASKTSGGSYPYVSLVKGLRQYSAAKEVGSFTSASDTYNKIFTMCRNSFSSNLMWVLTDCPHREKSGWQEVPQLMAPSIAASWDIQSLWTKIAKDTTDSQYANGKVPDVAPEYPAWSGGFEDSPAWGSSSIRIPWWVYQLYGDTAILQSQYTTAKNYLAYLQTKASGNLIGYGLGDWGTPVTNNTQLVESCQYYEDAITMQQWATVLGNTTDATTYATLAGNIKTAFNTAYFNSTNHNYGSQQTDNAMPLYLGMAPAGEENNVLNALIASVTSAGYHVNCGEIGHRYMLQALTKYNRDDVVHQMITITSQPGFGYWASIGKTTTPEYWDGGGSQQHCMMDHINEWFANSVAGIIPAKPGYEEISIRPSVMANTTSAQYSLETIRGTVVSNWTKNGNNWALNVTIPANSTAKVYIPTFGCNGVTITEGTTLIWNNGSSSGTVTGVSYYGLEGTYPSLNNYVVFNVGSGIYGFTMSGIGATPTPSPTVAPTPSPGGLVIDQDCTAGSFSTWQDISATWWRMQIFKPSTSNLPRVDFYTFKSGSPASSLRIRIMAVDASDNPTGSALFSVDVPASSIPASLGPVIIYPNLTTLTAGAKYAIVLSSTGSDSFGFGYTDSNPYANGYQRYSSNSGGAWTSESSRDLKFATYKNGTGPTATPTPTLTPTPTPAITATPTPTPAATPTPGGTLLTDDFSGDLSKWVNTTNCSISGGQLTVANNEVMRSASGGTSWTNYSYEADVKITSATVGLVFRSQDDNNFYMWQLYTVTGKLRPHKKVGGTFTVIKEVTTGTLANTTYHLKIEASGSTIKTYIDGSLVDTLTDTAFSSGKVGFREYTGESAVIDNVVVTAIP
jgi:alpha-L-rhamnosidase